MVNNVDEQIMEEKTVPVAWTGSYLIKIYKDKKDPLQCKNFRNKLHEVGLKVLEKVMDKRLRKVVTMGDAQFGFQLKKGTIDAMFIFRQVQEKFLEKREKVFAAFLHLKKAYDLVHWCMKRREIQKQLAKIVKATYEKQTTRVRIPSGDTKEFKIKVGLHQGSYWNCHNLAGNFC